MHELLKIKTILTRIALESAARRAARNRFPITGGTYDMTEGWSSSGISRRSWTGGS